MYYQQNLLLLSLNHLSDLIDYDYIIYEQPHNHGRSKQKKTAAFGSASLFSDFKLTWKNDDLLFPRHK